MLNIRRLLLAPFILMALIAVTLAVLVSVDSRAGAIDDEDACNDVPTGYQCVDLVNKGAGQVVGELFFRLDGSDLTLLTNLFGGL
ncbi:MAG TPA: hypothetical protein VIW01_13510, partial [Dehalococcoidia bacterium]